MDASHEGHKEVVALLLSHGVDINVQDEDQCTVLTFTCAQGDQEMAELLIKAGANLELGEPSALTAARCSHVRLELYTNGWIADRFS